MAGEFFSGAVCQKENGENCSTEAAVDSRFTLVKKLTWCTEWCLCVIGVGDRVAGFFQV